MDWQNGDYTDTTLNPGELIAMIKAKKSRICYIDCVVHLHSLVNFISCFPVHFRENVKS